jgi:hypothetical protein
MKQKKFRYSDKKVFEASEPSLLTKRDHNIFYERMSVCMDNEEDRMSAKSLSTSSVFSMKKRKPKNSFFFF